METNFQEVTSQIIELQQRKNQDYGNAFSQSFAEFGMISPVIRLNDKLNRLKSLLNRQNYLVADEKVEDTLMDMAAYAIMTIVELRNR